MDDLELAYYGIDSESGHTLVPYDHDACIDALYGIAVPSIAGPHHPAQQMCLVRGMRYVDGFGEELRNMSPIYTRSLNARQIMSNKIPVFTCQNDIPYCIWHPAIAEENIYRRLLETYREEYPGLAYQVGRACAVAGYTELYKELDILPDAHIAEEARESGSREIYNLIMAQSTRYDIMDDYTLSVHLEARKPVNLNGDTIVSWMLNIKQEMVYPTFGYNDPATGDFVPHSNRGFSDRYFNITEDMHIDEYESDIQSKRLSITRLEVQLLHETLPVDLPTVQKDLLIVMAAYYGDIDRYVRLRRPVRVESEDYCCRRGCYHNPMFARWWSQQPGQKPEGLLAAVNACMIQRNILSDAPYPPSDTPYIIWWPRMACETTYRELARVQPSMLPQILHACIEGAYVDLFDDLLPQVTPTQTILKAAGRQTKPHFREAIQRRVMSIEEPLPEGAYRAWRAGENPTSTDASSYVGNNSILTSEGRDAESGEYCDASRAELIACLPRAWRTNAADQADSLLPIDYRD